jgi:hypothetical protein
MRYLVVISLFWFIVSVACDQHLHANGPFGKKHSAFGEPSPHACNRPSGVSSETAAPIILNVTATVYSSNEQINVTWTSTSKPCTDDFVGIYFVEIPLSEGT